MLDRLATQLVPGAAVAPPLDGQRRAAVAAILLPSDDGPQVLLMKRAERDGDPWSGHISLPGGRYEPSDPDLLATAIRETQEELAIDLTSARLLGRLAPLHPRSAGPHGIEVTPFVFAARERPRPQRSAEAESTFWLPLTLAAAGTLDGTYVYPGAALAFPCWTFEGHTIWGLTMRILGDLIERTR
jgi:8-oxo-dGTP pyrophosphatase MutT (NUDIX family)